MRLSLTILFFIVIISLSAQAPTGFNVVDIPDEESSFAVSVEFDATAAGPVETTGGSVVLFVPNEYTGATITSANGGSWTLSSNFDNATLEGACGAGTAENFRLMVFTNTGTADDLGSVTAGVAEDLFSVVLTGGVPTTDDIQLLDPTGGDDLSACLVASFNNTINVDPDGAAGAAAEVGYEDLGPASQGAAFALPIEISSFDVTKRGERSAVLNWTTSSEQNASHYEIERSYNGSAYDYVGSVTAVGESKELVHYDFVDQQIDLSSTQNTMVYYRLKMLDNDGSYEYSEVKVIEFEARDIDVEVSPNPTADFIQLHSTAAITGVTIYGINGQILQDNIAYDGKLDFTNFQNGMYKIVVFTENGTFVKSIVKID